MQEVSSFPSLSLKLNDSPNICQLKSTGIFYSTKVDETLKRFLSLISIITDVTYVICENNKSTNKAKKV